jgi:hypothetical protein
MGAPPQAADQREVGDRMPELLAGLTRHYSPALVETVARCLQLDPLRRPQSVFALQRALRESESAEDGVEVARPQGLARWLDTIAGRLGGRRRRDDETITLQG